jgi:hypothetical protein
MEWMKIDKEMATATYDSVGKHLMRTEICLKMGCAF